VNVGINVVNFLSTFLALYAVDRLGRRILFVAGGTGMCIFTALFSLFTSPHFNYKENTALGIMLTVFTAMYVMNFAYSWGPLVSLHSLPSYPPP